MSWAKIDDNFYDHPKVVAAGTEGIALFVCALSYSSRYLTDGFIPAPQVRRLIETDDPERAAQRLVAVGLWDQTAGGYHIHDYLKYNPSAAQVQADRDATAKRKAEWRDKHNGNGDGTVGQSCDK